MSLNFGDNDKPGPQWSGMNVTLRGGGGVRIHDDASEDLVDVALKVKDLRERASAANKSHVRRVSDIEADENLSETGRAKALADENSAHKASQRGLRDTEASTIENKITELERRLDGHRGYASSDIIAFRDAQDRAEAITSPDQATRVMARALRNDDRTLAHAVFRQAVDNGWTEARNQFAAKKPDVARIVDDIDKLHRLRNEFGRALRYA